MAPWMLGLYERGRLDHMDPGPALDDLVDGGERNPELAGHAAVAGAGRVASADLAHQVISQLRVAAALAPRRASLPGAVGQVRRGRVPAEVVQAIVQRVVVGVMTGQHTGRAGADERLQHQTVYEPGDAAQCHPQIPARVAK